MKRLANLYDYLFYTIYRFWEKAPSRWWSDWKTVITMSILMGCFLSAISNIVTGKLYIDLIPKSTTLPLILVFLICGFHYYLYSYKSKWKEKIIKFQNISPKKDFYGIFMVVCYFLLITGSLIYSWYLLSKVDWDIVRPFP